MYSDAKFQKTSGQRKGPIENAMLLDPPLFPCDVWERKKGGIRFFCAQSEAMLCTVGILFVVTIFFYSKEFTSQRGASSKSSLVTR